MLKLALCLLISSLRFVNLGGDDDLVKDFSNGLYQPISAQCGFRTQVTFNGKDGLYTRDEVSRLLRDFFTMHHADKCTVLQNTSSSKGAGVLIIKYFSGDNIYKITVYKQALQNQGGELQSIRIEPQSK